MPEYGLQFTEPLTAAPAANQAAVVTFANTPGATARFHIVSIVGSYSATPTGGLLTATDGTLTFTVYVPAAGPFSLPSLDWRFNAGQNVTCTLAAAGAAVSGALNVVATIEF